MTESHDEPQDNRDTRLEAALRAALQHQQPSPGFAERVEAKLLAQDARRSGWTILHPHSTWLQIAIAAVLLLAIIIPMGLRLQHRAQVAKGEAARDQVLLALRITGTQLRTIQHRTRFIDASPLSGDSQ